MTWWKRREKDEAELQAAKNALAEAKMETRRVAMLADDIKPGLAQLEVHRRDNHILDAMMTTLGKGLV